jgi:hypothetical protein
MTTLTTTIGEIIRGDREVFCMRPTSRPAAARPRCR